MVQDDRFFHYRLRLFARAREVGVTQACRELGYHRSWYYCEDFRRSSRGGLTLGTTGRSVPFSGAVGRLEGTSGRDQAGWT